MDRLQRRQIGARPFLRTAKFSIFHNWHSNSVRFGACERGKCHEFNVWDIHGTATGNLFFLVHGACGISSFIISLCFRSWSLFERALYRVEFCWRRKHPWSRESIDSPVDAELEKRRPNLAAIWRLHIYGVFVWRQHLPPHSFYGFHVAGGNCGLTLII